MTTTTTTIALKRSRIEEAILWGDTHDGAYYLVVPAEPSGPNDYRVRWYRSWGWNEPWRDDDYLIRIPALYPGGLMAEIEQAEDLLEALVGKEEMLRIRDECDENNKSFVEWVREHYPGQWRAAQRQKVASLADDWLDGLNDPATWEGRDEHGLPVRRPHPAFEWES